MDSRLSTVISLYLDGVTGGFVIPAADKYLTADFVDHLGPPGSGRAAFVEAYEPLVYRYADRFVWPLRGFVDGDRVFLHSLQTFGRGQIRRVCVDVFETDADGLLAGRWSLGGPLASGSRSGRSQIDGPTAVTDHDRTDDHKRLVLDFHRTVLVAGDYDRLPAFVRPDLAEHATEVADGLVGLRHHLRTQGPGSYEAPVLVVGAGCYVAILAGARRGGRPHRVFDLYRLAGGLIAEHWEVAVARD